MKALAEAPTRATTSFTLSWSLVNIPVSMFTGTEPTRVERKEFLDGTGIPVGRAAIRKDTGEVIESAAVVRMAEASNGTWVVLTDDEIAACTSPKGVGEIVAFVPNKNVGNYLAETLNQVRPKATKGKVDAMAARSFALLMGTLKRTKTHALVKVALRGPARYALLDQDGNFTLVRTHDAIRQSVPVDKDFVFSDEEIALASQLVTLVGVGAPVLTDDTAPAVQAFVNAKAAGAPAPVAPEAPVASDLMASLTASVAAAKQAKAA
jgi:DNA end-binding protein Ku